MVGARKQTRKKQIRKKYKHCCERMAIDFAQKCGQHPDRFDCPDMFFDQLKNGSYGLIVYDGGRSVVKIAFCPWCGPKLPQRTASKS
jgi:hypothetical protein